MTIELKYAQTKHDLLELAKNNPEKVYDPVRQDSGAGTCVYFTEDGSPSCIVGHVLNKHGVKRDDMIIQNKWRRDLNYTTSVDELSDSDFIRVDEKTQKLLTKVQDYQDNQKPWSDAVKTAIQFVEERYP